MTYFLYCRHCRQEGSANPANYWNYNANMYVVCPHCLKPMELHVRTFRNGLKKIAEKCTIETLRNPPTVIEAKDITVLLVQRGYKRFVHNNGGMVPLVVWSLTGEELKDTNWEERMACWDNNDVIHWNREQERMNNHDIDREANRRFLNEPRGISPFDP